MCTCTIALMIYAVNDLGQFRYCSLASDVRRLLSSPVSVCPDSVLDSVTVGSVPSSDPSGTGAKLLIAVGAVVSD